MGRTDSERLRPPQIPRIMPTSDGFLWMPLRNLGTSGSQVEFTLPYGLSPASCDSGRVALKQRRLHLRSSAIAAASTVLTESDPRCALVADEDGSVPGRSLLSFLRLVFAPAPEIAVSVAPVCESAPLQPPRPTAVTRNPLPLTKSVGCRVVAIKVKHVAFGPAKPIVPVKLAYSVSREWVQQICNVFCPPQAPRSLHTSHGLYWITLRYFGTAGALLHGLKSASPVSLEQVYLRLRSAAFAHSGQRSALVAGRRPSSAAQILSVFLQLVLGFIEGTDDATLDLESPLVLTPTDGTVSPPAFGIENASSSPTPAYKVAEDVEADTKTEGELPVSSQRKRKRHPRARGGKKVQAAKARNMAEQALEEAENVARLAEQSASEKIAADVDKIRRRPAWRIHVRYRSRQRERKREQHRHTSHIDPQASTDSWPPGSSH
ncbi:uncharacterized protein B0H18DRAFT_311593 [Fomitopsis serialis]|uniref:uncharacterized protein n=1 Tax=Fomitopsis serialis TaxID=139415 RepID=UPI002007A322|nr:uncharacterized protein B0H18DRAFT_311593 [Neoantrodia serialis]KAH9936081.1 hypothetical protein B0H18DRAFT_311593 [Neoantrodia serialis]